MTHNNKATVQIMVYWQKCLTCRVPLQKAHSTCAPRKFVSETLVWPDLVSVRETRTALGAALESDLFVFCFFFFHDPPLWNLFLSVSTGRSEVRVRGQTQSRGRVLWRDCVSYSGHLSRAGYRADYRTVPHHYATLLTVKLTMTFWNVTPPNSTTVR